jgi:ABC-type uncharacterized transport system ATPase subunit
MTGMPSRPAESPAGALEVDRLSVKFGTNQVLQDLSFSVPLGSSLVVIGPNGGGKRFCSER